MDREKVATLCSLCSVLMLSLGMVASKCLFRLHPEFTSTQYVFMRQGTAAVLLILMLNTDIKRRLVDDVRQQDFKLLLLRIG